MANSNWIIYFRQTRSHTDVKADMTRLLTEQGVRVYNVNQPTVYPATEAESGGGDWLVRVSSELDGWTLASLFTEHGYELTACRPVLARNPDPLTIVDSRLKDQ